MSQTDDSLYCMRTRKQSKCPFKEQVITLKSITHFSIAACIRVAFQNLHTDCPSVVRVTKILTQAHSKVFSNCLYFACLLHMFKLTNFRNEHEAWACKVKKGGLCKLNLFYTIYLFFFIIIIIYTKLQQLYVLQINTVQSCQWTLSRTVMTRFNSH